MQYELGPYDTQIGPVRVDANIEDLIVKRGPYIDHPRYVRDAWITFVHEWGNRNRVEAKRAFRLWLAEGRTEPGGPLIYSPQHGDTLVHR